ncbi:retrovirus-related pol polyprotein from transposon TNT 1-94 [Tanacetum coccineum]
MTVKCITTSWQLVQGIVHQCLQQDDMHNGDHGSYDTLIQDQNGDALRKCILKGLYTPTIVTTPVVPATEDSPAVPEQTTVETVTNMTLEKQSSLFEYKRSGFILILTGFGDEYTRMLNAYTRQRDSQTNPLHHLRSVLKKDSDPEQAQKDKDMRKICSLICKANQETLQNLPTITSETSSNTRKQYVATTPRYKNDNQTGPLWNKEGSEYTDEEIDEQELEAHYSYMAKIQEVPNEDSGVDVEPLEQVQYDTDDNVFANDIQHFDQSEYISNTCAVEMGDSNVTPGLLDMCDNNIQDDQNDLDVDENKKIQRQLKKANATLAQELTECKSILAKTSRTLGESNSIRDIVIKRTMDELVKQSLLTKSHTKVLSRRITNRMVCLKDVMCFICISLSDLDEITELQCLYLHKVRECDCLAQKLSEQTEFEREQYLEIQDLKVQLQDKNIAISELKKLIDKCKGKSMDTKFDKPSVVRQPNAQRIPKPSVLGKRTSNVNVVCATCGKCVFNSNHDDCVSKYLNDVNARTKKPNGVPINLVQGNITIKRVYYVEGLNHNLFSVGQFCDADLEVAFRKSTCFVRDLQGNYLLTGNRGTDLYIISLQETTSSTPICLMAKASPTQAWLWHRRLSHLNFDYINLLSKKDVVIGLPKLKYVKDQLCSSCKVSKVKQSSFKSKTVPSSKGWLNLLHMDLCGPMRVASINGKKYILVIVDDYSRYTWTLFLRSKDETPEVLKDFLTMIQRNLQAPVISVRTDRGTEFLNKTLNAFFKEEGIEHQTSTPRTPEQNGVLKVYDQEEGIVSKVSLLRWLAWRMSGVVYVAQPDGCVVPEYPDKVFRLRKALVGLKHARVPCLDELSKFLISKGFTKGLSDQPILARGIHLSLQCPTCKKCLYSANHDDCVLEYLSRLNPRASAQNKDEKSYKKTKRYMPVEKSSASKKPERQIPTGHRKVIQLLHGQGTSFNGQKQQRIDLNADALYNEKQENLRVWPRSSMFKRRLIIADQASVFMAMMSVHISSGLVLHQMTSDHNRSELGIQDHSNE